MQVICKHWEEYFITLINNLVSDLKSFTEMLEIVHSSKNIVQEYQQTSPILNSCSVFGRVKLVLTLGFRNNLPTFNFQNYYPLRHLLLD